MIWKQSTACLDMNRIVAELPLLIFNLRLTETLIYYSNAFYFSRYPCFNRMALQ